MKATIREEIIQIPTYISAQPEKCPLFIEKRAYQGSTGKVYPLPVTEKIYDEKEMKSYRALVLENDYLYVVVLPELGGRIQRAYDKTNGYDFVYYNRVVKPALVGLAGPWISGGIEFNWPQHHRPTTFSPVDFSVSENADGSVTAYVGETDTMYGTKGMAAITLYPDKAYIEIKGQLYNPTDFPQTFLWWANPAVPVNDNTYSVFPPDVNAVMDHGKRAVSTFPIATGEYYKYDYSEGVDISRYKNIKVPTSYMAAHSDFDFIGNFDEGRDAGLIHVADHHVSPGKKQWTWGCGDFGRMWDKNLTDEDGPYIELMTGVFTDNQPDFSWLKPHEEKTFTQYSMPYKTVGRVSNATKDAVIGFDGSSLRVYSTSPRHNAHITVTAHGKEVYAKTVDLSPRECFCDEVSAPDGYCVKVADENGKILCECREYIKKNEPVPEPAKAPEAPQNVKSLEELYLIGLHLEQYRHATYSPADYYLEGLKRDSSDIRLNNAYGLLLLRSGRISESIKYFETAVEKQTMRNPNPYGGECRYNLALAYELNGEFDKAYDAFYKASWSAETQAQSFYHLACLCTRKKEYEKALDFAEHCLSINFHNMKARVLKAELLKLVGRDNSAFLKESYDIDRLSAGVLFAMGKPLGGAKNYLSLAADYMQYGLFDRADEILDGADSSNPMTWYFKGYAALCSENAERAKTCFEKAEEQSPGYVFPNTITEMLALEAAVNTLDDAPMASYYLGNLLYDKKRYSEAVKCWEAAVGSRPDLAMAHRNLSIAYFNKEHDGAKAMLAVSKACITEPDNCRFILERDQLCAKLDVPAEERLSALEEHMNILEQRDALYLAYITLLNSVGRYGDALACLESHKFHPWEGGEGKVAEQYKTALFALAEKEMERGEYETAEALCRRTLNYPENLGEGKLPNVPDNQANFMIGECLSALGREDDAREYFALAASGSQTPDAVRYYNDQPGYYIYYQGLAFSRLGDSFNAARSFRQMVSFGERHIFDKVTYDFFAVSMPELEVYQDNIQKRSDDYCKELIRLGKAGLEKIGK